MIFYRKAFIFSFISLLLFNTAQNVSANETVLNSPAGSHHHQTQAHSKKHCLEPSSCTYLIQEEMERPFFLSFGSGASFSRKSKIFANPLVWDPAVEGYDNKLKQTAIYSVGFGYEFTPLIRISVDGTYRPGFRYRKFQTKPSDSSQPLATDQKTRKFDLSNRSLMANLTFLGKGFNFYSQINPEVMIQPFLGVGAGISNHQTTNFHSILTTQTIVGSGLNDISVMGDGIKSKTSFAWQLEGGFEMLYCQKFGLELGYRYFHGGKYKTTDHIFPGAVPFLPAPYAVGAVQTLPWIGKLTTQELFIKLRYHFH